MSKRACAAFALPGWLAEAGSLMRATTSPGAIASGTGCPLLGKAAPSVLETVAFTHTSATRKTTRGVANTEETLRAPAPDAKENVGLARSPVAPRQPRRLPRVPHHQGDRRPVFPSTSLREPTRYHTCI